MKNKSETKEEREQRKAIFIQRATALYDTPQIRKEAEEMFEKMNPPLNTYTKYNHRHYWNQDQHYCQIKS